MSHHVWIIGIGAEGISRLPERSLIALASATLIAGGRRHLELLGETTAETFVVGDNIAALVDRLHDRGPDERCVVLASGDPLFYGIGHRLSVALGPGEILVEPALSSMQLAFARAGLSWQDAAIASVHGRPLARTLLPLLGKPKIGLFTQDGASPSAVARFFEERGLDDYDAWVGERLGTADETVTFARLPDLIGRAFDALNFLILRRNPEDFPVVLEGRFAGIADAYFAQPTTGPVLLTHADVRAVTLARFLDLPEGPLWDIGAGLGGVAVELARAFPEREVVAVERSDAQLGYLRINRARFGVYNLRIVAGEAPDCCDGEERPAGVFVGGSGGRLDDVLALVLERLASGGRLVANFIALEHLGRTLDRLRSAGWPTDLTQVQITPAQPLAGLTTLVPQRPVFVVRGIRPPA